MQNKGIHLPKNADALCRIMKAHAIRCESHYMWRRMCWLLAWYYLNGYRKFDVVNSRTGQIKASYLAENGKIPFQSHELLFAINQVVGQIQGMDLRPQVQPQGLSLSAQRDRALSQITLNGMTSHDHVRAIQEAWAFNFVCLGFSGISGDVQPHPTIGLAVDLEVVHPREIFPFPATGFDHTQAGGWMRQRWVPLNVLHDKYGKGKVNKGLAEKIEWIEQESGEPTMDPATDAMDSSPHLHGSGTHVGLEDEDGLKFVRTRELWLSGPGGTISRYACASGDMLFEDVDLTNTHTFPSMSFARFLNNGSWYGAGLFDIMFHQHQQLEELSRRLYQNVMSMDSYGVVVMPSGFGAQAPILKDVGAGLKMMFAEYDSLAGGFNPFVIAPHNAGEFPGRVAAFARESMKQVHPLPDILSEKGRVDSASGLNLLMEQASQALTTPTNNVTNAWGALWRGVHQKALSKIHQGTRTLPLVNPTLDLAGAIIDPKEGTISFGEGKNPFPDMTRLSYTIRSNAPRSQAARKQEVMELVKNGFIANPIDVRLLAWEEDLDFAMYMKDDFNAIEMGIRAILTLFNDGETPGQLILTPHTTKAPIVARLLETFMVGPIFINASPPVHDAFKQFRLLVMSWMGTFLPPGVPAPEGAVPPDLMMQGSPASQPSPGGQPPLRIAQG